MAATAITIKALDLDLIVMSAFSVHTAVETGLFAPFSPVTFGYAELGPYSLFFAARAVVCAVAAGVVVRMHQEVSRSGGLSLIA